MEETNFVLLWKEQYEKIDQSLVINKQLLKEIILPRQSILQIVQFVPNATTHLVYEVHYDKSGEYPGLSIFRVLFL